MGLVKNNVLRKFTSIMLSVALVLSFLTLFPPKFKAADSSYITMLIEGLNSEIYSGKVNFTDGESFYDIMSTELAAKNIKLNAPKSAYGHYIVSIGGEKGTYPVWWHIYVNGAASELGADALKPKSGDKIVVYLGDDSDILYPTVSVTPKTPVEGQTAVFNVSSTYTDYSGAEPVAKTVNISGAHINFNGKVYTTDSDGNASIPMPSAGEYTFTVEKKNKDTTPAVVNIGSISLTVAKDKSSSDSSGKSNNNQTSGTGSVAADTTGIDTVIESAADYLSKNYADDWGGAVALSRAGRSVPQSYFKNVSEEISDGDVLPTHLAGLIIGIKAAGGNPRSFNGQDLIAQLLASNIGMTGLNGYTYGLIALDCGNYEIPSSSHYTRESLISDILSYQKPNGAFSLDKNSSADIDMTAIAITALAPYTSDSKVKTAIESAVAYLSSAQRADGGFLPSYSSSEASESTSQVILALTSIGIDPKTDARFIKNGKSVIDALLSYRMADGGFEHMKGSGSDYVATEQAVMALCAYRLYLKTGARIFDLTDVKSSNITIAGVKNPSTGEPVPVEAVLLLTSAAFACTLKFKRSKK